MDKIDLQFKCIKQKKEGRLATFISKVVTSYGEVAVTVSVPLEDELEEFPELIAALKKEANEAFKKVI